MRAVVLHTPGQPPQVGDHPDPVVGPGHTLVRVTAVPVVPLDLLCASGTSYFGEPAVPYVPGVQGVGVVEQSGSVPAGHAGVVRHLRRDGRRATAGWPSGASYPTTTWCRSPTGPTTPRSPRSGLSAVAAWMCLTWRARLQPGETVLVLGAGGAVGQSVIGAARVLGAGRVVGVCRPGPSTERARAAGADEVVALHDDPDAMTSLLTSQLRRRRRRRRRPGRWARPRRPPCGCSAVDGRLVNLGGSMADAATYSSAVLRSRSLEILGYTNNAISPEQRRDALTAVLAARGRGHGSAVAHETWPLDRARRGLGATGRRRGERAPGAGAVRLLH